MIPTSWMLVRLLLVVAAMIQPVNPPKHTVLGIVILITMLLSGCGNGRKICEQEIPSSENATVPFQERYVAYCEFLARCSPDSLDSYHGGDVQSCAAYYECKTPRPPSWKITPQCTEAIRALECTGDIGQTLYQPECAVSGPLPPAQEGESCKGSVCRGDELPVSYTYCDTGLWCDRDDICRAYTKKGEACSVSEEPGTWDDPCTPGTYCDAAAGMCLARVAIGASCELQTVRQIDPCVAPSSCEQGRCVEPPVVPTSFRASIGEACEAETGVCKYGLACVESVCREVVCKGPAGAPCFGASCAEGLVCNSRTEQCEEPGSPCLDDDRYEPCTSGLFCNHTDTCQTDPFAVP